MSYTEEQKNEIKILAVAYQSFAEYISMVAADRDYNVTKLWGKMLLEYQEKIGVEVFQRETIEYWLRRCDEELAEAARKRVDEMTGE